jgi:RHS repeat-associated protein
MVFHHNGFGRLRRLSVRGIVNVDRDYRYSAGGQRTGITTHDLATGAVTTERYSYDGHDVDLELIRTVTATSTNDRTRVYWNVTGEIDHRIGFVDTVGGVATFYYYLTDQVGTVLQVVREDGAIVNQYDYDAWGNVQWHSPHTFTNVPNRYLFQGREYDAAGDFYYYRYRTYLPEIGMFASPDWNRARGIYGEPLGVGSFIFCNYDPLNATDPLGLWTQAQWNSILSAIRDKHGQHVLGMVGEKALDRIVRRSGQLILHGPSTGATSGTKSVDMISIDPASGN